ncbi:MAG: hypothetical protein WC450_07770 [Candidatus Omnitrophota bacterium]|jgi:glucan phosphoethanolaminetransferase (alkaline phosphatase superfamily)
MKQIPANFFFHLKIFIVAEFLLATYFIMSAVINRISLLNLKQQLMAGYHFPYTNSCTVGNLLGINIHLHIIIFILIFLLTYVLWQRLFTPSSPPPFDSTLRMLPTAGLALSVFLMTIQTVNHVNIFTNERRLFSGKSVSDKQRFIHKQPYEFAQYCRRQFPGRHKGFLRTDLDPHNEPFATQHRKLAYFLFPDIDIRHAYLDTAYDCLIFYEEKNGTASIPPGFKIKGMFDNQHFLAVKEQAE